jgi:sugar phosphate permease
MLAGSTQPFLVNGMSKMVTTWFAEKERPLALSIVTLGITMGVMMGMAFGSVYVSYADMDDKAAGKTKCVNFLF